MACAHIHTIHLKRAKIARFILYCSDTSFWLLEHAIKVMLSSGPNCNAEPPVFTLSNIGLTISHVKQLSMYVTVLQILLLGDSPLLN